MSEHISNLLIGTETTVNSNKYLVAKYKITETLVVGTTYTISAYVEELECEGKTPNLIMSEGTGLWGPKESLTGDIPGVQTITFTYSPAYQDGLDPNYISIYNTHPYSNAKRKAVLHHVMLVEGDTPAAWAPAEGETLTADAGGVDAMSSNLLSGISPELRNGATKDGYIYTIPKGTTGPGHSMISLFYDLSIPKLESNRAFHIGFSRKALSTSTDGVLIRIQYKDDAGNYNYNQIFCDNTSASWKWFSGSMVIPSGMTIYRLYINAFGLTNGMYITNVTLSYDSPVVLAMSEMTATDIKDGTNWKGADGISIESVIIQD